MCSIKGVDDLEEFEAVVKAFESMGLKEEQRHTIWSVVSGVLLLGNVITAGRPASNSTTRVL